MAFPANVDNRYVYVGGISDERTEAAHVAGTLAFGSVAAALTEVVSAAAMTAGAVNVEIVNTTDQPVIASYDNSTTHRYVAANGGASSVDYAGLNRKVTTGVFIKRAGSAPSLGAVYVNVTF